MEIATEPAKGATLGIKSGTTIAQAEKINPTNPRVLLIKGIGKLFTPPLFGGSREQAMASFEAAIAKLPPERFSAVNWGLDDAYVWRRIAQQHAGDTALARASFEQALVVAPNQQWAATMLRATAAK